MNWQRVMNMQAVGGKTDGRIVVVRPFDDYTKAASDEWLPQGLADLTASMLAASGSLRVFSGPSVAISPDAKGPEFVVSGMFQHMEKGLRAFVKLSRGDQTLLSQYEVLVPYPDNNQIFMDFAEVATKIWQVMGVSGDNGALAAVRDATTSTRAFESYEKGKQTLEGYRQSDMEVAKTWFEQAKRNDYRSPLGYQGMIDLLTFLGLYHKQRRDPFGLYFEQAERELSDMNRLAKKPAPYWTPVKKPSKKDKGAVALKNRFLLGHASFNEGLIAAENGKWPEAAAAFKRSVEFVPEDSVSWYQLARVYENLGNAAEASAALRKAYEVNPCVEK